MTAARMRAVGTLLLEGAGIALLIGQRLGKDLDLRVMVGDFVKKVRAL
jgi:hypothetical protein